MEELSPRLRAVCDLHVADVRESSGRHEYDGTIQDLSPDGVRSGLARLEQARASGGTLGDPHDEAHLTAFEDLARTEFGQLKLHRRNPLYHLAELDLACYDRDYAPEPQRAAARLAHLAAWPRATDNAIAALDQVSAPVAAALLGAARGLALGIPDQRRAGRAAALAAHERLVTHLERAAEQPGPDTALGSAGLAALMGSARAWSSTWAGWPSRPIPSGTGCASGSPRAARGWTRAGRRWTSPASWSATIPTPPG